MVGYWWGARTFTPRKFPGILAILRQIGFECSLRSCLVHFGLVEITFPVSLFSLRFNRPRPLRYGFYEGGLTFSLRTG